MHHEPLEDPIAFRNSMLYKGSKPGDGGEVCGWHVLTLERNTSIDTIKPAMICHVKIWTKAIQVRHDVN